MEASLCYIRLDFDNYLILRKEDRWINVATRQIKASYVKTKSEQKGMIPQACVEKGLAKGIN